MSVRRSPDPRRVVVLVIASLVGMVAIAVVTSVFSGFDILGQRYAVVHFDASVSPKQQARIQRACAQPPAVNAEPIRGAGRADARQTDVRYRVDDADDGDIATLSKCLKGHQGVIGISLSDLTLG